MLLWEYLSAVRYISLSSYGYNYAVTMAFGTLVIVQLFNTANARSTQFSNFSLQTNWYLWGARISSLLLVFLLIEIPFFQNVLFTTSLEVKDWGIIFLVCSSIFVFEEIRKGLIRMKEYCIQKNLEME